MSSLLGPRSGTLPQLAKAWGELLREMWRVAKINGASW